MDDALKQKIIKIRDTHPNENIIKLTEIILHETEKYCPGEIVRSTKTNENCKIIEIFENKYRTQRTSDKNVNCHIIEEVPFSDLKRINLLTRNEIRKVLLSTPRVNNVSSVSKKQPLKLPRNASPIPVSNIGRRKELAKKVSIPNNPSNNQINNIINKTEVKINKPFEMPKTTPLSFTFLPDSSKIGKLSILKQYLRIYTFLYVYHEYFEIPRPTFNTFNTMLLDFNKFLPVLLKIFITFQNEKKTKKRRFYDSFKQTYEIFFNKLEKVDTGVLEKKGCIVWYLKKVSSSNIADYLNSFVCDLAREAEVENVCILKGINKNMMEIYRRVSSHYIDTKSKNFTEIEKTFINSISTDTNSQTETQIDAESAQELFTELQESIKNRLIVLHFLIELFGETCEAKILNENISAFLRECVKKHSGFKAEVRATSGEIDKLLFTINGEDTNNLPNFDGTENIQEQERMQRQREKLSDLREKLSELHSDILEINTEKFNTRFDPYIGKYKSLKFMYLDDRVIIEKDGLFRLVRKDALDLLRKEIKSERVRDEKGKALIDSLLVIDGLISN